MAEVWKDIPSLPDYQASSYGRLMRRPYQKPMPHGGVRMYGGQPTKGQWDGSRFILVYKRKTYKVHRLVCEAFHGTAPFEGAVVMHLNENAANNAPENLQWGTQKENLHAPGYIAYARRERAKLTEDDVAIIRDRHAAGESMSALGREFGVAQWTVSKIVRRVAWNIGATP